MRARLLDAANRLYKLPAQRSNSVRLQRNPPAAAEEPDGEPARPGIDRCDRCTETSTSRSVLMTDPSQTW